MQDTFLKVVEEMKSDYFPKQEEGANNFINLGYSIEELRKIIDEDRNPHLVSMYLYICGKTNNSMIGWEYVQKRVLTEFWLYKNIDMMKINMFEKPSKEENEQRYLFNAARKWLITKKQFSVFLEHMKIQNMRLKEKRSNLLRRYNGQFSESSTILDVDYDVVRYLKKVKTALKEINNSEISNSLTFTDKEIGLASEISSLQNTVIGDIPKEIYPENLYQYWLKSFFLETASRQIKNIEYLRKILDEKMLEELFGFDRKYVEYFYQFVLTNKDNKSLKDSRYLVEKLEIQEAYIKLRNEIINNSEEQWLIQGYLTSKYSNLKKIEGIECYQASSTSYTNDSFYSGSGIRYLTKKDTNEKIAVYIDDKRKPEFGNIRNPLDICVDEFYHNMPNFLRCWYMTYVMRKCTNMEFKLKFLDEFLENVVNYNDKNYMEFLMYYLFEQTEFVIQHNFDFLNTCSYDIKQEIEFFEKYLLKYLDIKYFEKDEMYRGYMALSVLINKKSEKSIKFFFDIIY